MNHYAIKQSSFAACEEIWASSAAGGGRSADKRDTVVCPKPRRIGFVHTAVEPSYAPRPLVRWHMSHQQQDDCDSKAGNELLDIILAKDDSVPLFASSPPFFSGSPPSRVSNPLIQDARFGEEKVSSAASFILNASGPPALSPRKGGCVRPNFGNNPAVRVEGFDCLDRDRRNCSIPTLA